MTIATDLLSVLKEEEAALYARRFEALADFQKRKEYLVGQLDATASTEDLGRIRAQAKRNERALTITMSAVRGLKARFAQIGAATQSVGYAEGGERVSCEDASSQRRV